MGDSSDRTTDFATLFETVTGQSTLTEHQQIDIPVRYYEHEEKDISDYIDTTPIPDGFEDVIEVPETH